MINEEILNLVYEKAEKICKDKEKKIPCGVFFKEFEFKDRFRGEFYLDELVKEGRLFRHRTVNSEYWAVKPEEINFKIKKAGK